MDGVGVGYRVTRVDHQVGLQGIQRPDERQQPVPTGGQVHVGYVQHPYRPGAGGKHRDVVAAQRKPVALDDRGVADKASPCRCGADEDLSSHLHMVSCPPPWGRLDASARGPPGTGVRRARSPRTRQDVLMAGLKDRLRTDLTAAMKARDTVRTRTLRMVLTSVSNEEVSGTAHELSDDDVLRLIAREARRRREAAEAFDAAGRTDQAAAERAEDQVLAEYPPAQLSDAEVASIVADVISETGASGMGAMGQVMKAVTPRVAGRAEGGRVAAEVRRALAG